MNNNDILNSLAELIKNNNSSKGISIKLAYKNFYENSKTSCRKVTLDYYDKIFKKLNDSLEFLGITYTNEVNKIVYKKLELYLHNLNYKNSSINKYTDLLKMIFKINYELEYINNNPINGIKKLKETIPEIKIISEKNLSKINNFLLKLQENYLNIRNICAIFILRDTGIRLNELLNLKVKNIYLKDNTIFLDYTKTNKTRYVFFNDQTKLYLKKYFNYKETNNNTYLFEINGKQIKKDFIYHFLDDISKNCDIDQSITPHKWRHTFITNLVEKNVNLSNIMTVAGHTEYSTTKRYIHQDINKLKNSILGK